MADAERPGDRDEQRLAELGYKQELNRGWSRLRELRDLVLDHLGARGVLHDSTGRRGSSAGRSRSRSAGRSSALLILIVALQHVRADLGLPDRGRPVLVGAQARRRRAGRGSPAGSTWSGWSASSPRSDYFCAFFLNSLFGLWGWDLGFVNFADTEHVLAEIFWLFVLILVAPCADQHLLVAPVSRCSTRSRCSGTWSAWR